MLGYRYVFSYGRLDPIPGSTRRGSDGALGTHPSYGPVRLDLWEYE
eukprot:SAG31_NODE_2214_length_6174_cov_3.902551_6_plen_46_part_00